VTNNKTKMTTTYKPKTPGGEPNFFSKYPSFKGTVDHQGNTPLIWASLYGRNDIVSQLIQNYDVPINVQNFEGESPLSAAVRNGNFDLVNFLLEKGANANLSNIRCETPLHLAACLGYLDICKELIRYGALIDLEDDCGDTPLHWAVREEKLEIVELLLSVGADPKHMNEDEESPQMLAQSVGSDSIASVFDSSMDTDIVDIGDDTAGFTFANSNDSFFVSSKISSIEDVSDDMELDLSDDGLSLSKSANINIDLRTSGTVYPSSFGKEDEYLIAGRSDNNKLLKQNNNYNNIFLNVNKNFV